MMLLTQASEKPRLKTQTHDFLFLGINNQRIALTCFASESAQLSMGAWYVVNIIDALSRSKVFRGGHPSVMLRCLKQWSGRPLLCQISPQWAHNWEHWWKMFFKNEIQWGNSQTKPNWGTVSKTTALESLKMSVAWEIEKGCSRLKKDKEIPQLCHVRSLGWRGREVARNLRMVLRN